MPKTETKIISNLEKAGVEFTNGDEPGVKLRKERQAEMIAAQCRAARGLLDWTPQKLADAAGVGVFDG